MLIEGVVPTLNSLENEAKSGGSDEQYWQFFLAGFYLKGCAVTHVIKKPTGFISWLFILYIEYF
ncbi:hypothetical protein [uncultured Psychrosphaera sp.]|uniref:hypothetical protein n=1 Tax=uncultured Psychrosphaera sp. TaxID=1403522 RepID=UPI0026086B64|nr:hypothetical protein [uncultured Psychrosphaera sp.]